MWITAFKTGTHKDRAGKLRTFTREHLDAIVKKFNPAVRKVPACKGHPDIDSPAYGWFDAVKREGDYLLMNMGEHVQEFGEQVKQGMFKYVSLALRPDMSIRHLGFLGGHPPAIDGLGELDKTEFASSEELEEFSFADYNASRIKRLFQNLREYLLVKDGQEEADSRIPQWQLDMLDDDVDASSFAAPPQPPTLSPETPMNLTTEQMQAENARLLAENTRLKGEASATGAQLTTLQFAAAREADKAYLQTLGTRVVPARAASVLDLMGILRQTGEFTFAEAGKKNAVDEFKSFLESLPEQLSFGEHATPDRAAENKVDDVGPASQKIRAAVAAKMEKNSHLNFSDASRLVYAEQPDLAKAYQMELIA